MLAHGRSLPLRELTDEAPAQSGLLELALYDPRHASLPWYSTLLDKEQPPNHYLTITPRNIHPPLPPSNITLHLTLVKPPEMEIRWCDQGLLEHYTTADFLQLAEDLFHPMPHLSPWHTHRQGRLPRGMALST